MGKLHEVLAVEPQLKAAAERAISTAKSAFTKSERFTGQVKTYTPLEEEGEQRPGEATRVATTVAKELAELEAAFGRWLDAAIQKEVTNQGTSAEVLLGRGTFISELPATALLNLESKLEALRAVYAAIPTNDPSESWWWDDSIGKWVSPERITYAGRKVTRPLVLYEATREHPAQVTTYNEDIRVGEWKTRIFSGMLSPEDKRARLERLDELLQAVKKARQRANDCEVVEISVAERIFAYINEGADLL